MSECIFYDQGWHEAPYCSKHRKYLDNGCGHCKPVTVDDIATGNFVEVVRCKDCKHHEELLYNNDENVLCWVHDIDVIVDRNGYCNYGEREEQDHD